MEQLTIDIDKEVLWFNYCILKSQYIFPLPVDFIQYICHCKEKLSILNNGDFFAENNVSSIPNLIEDLKNGAIQKHFLQGKCTKCRLSIDSDVGVPEVLIFGFKESSGKSVIQPFTLEETEYRPTLCIFSKEEDPVLAIFLRHDSQDSTYKDIVMKNFESHLNVPLPSLEETEWDKMNFDLEKVSDDEAASMYQQQLPRMTGGGRKMMQEFKYICQWCSDETLKHKTKGRFMEIKNYRDHFRRVHQDIPFTEFLNKVDRDDPKFHCKICNRKISLGNQLRHQIICRPPHYQGDNSSSDSSETEEDERKSVARKNTKNPSKQTKPNPDQRRTRSQK